MDVTSNKHTFVEDHTVSKESFKTMFKDHCRSTCIMMKKKQKKYRIENISCFKKTTLRKKSDMNHLNECSIYLLYTVKYKHKQTFQESHSKIFYKNYLIVRWTILKNRL